jgi:HPt (histidine-containing phosphotransfer) domain-containing protein/HAMP domain-containing protein
MGTTAPDRRVLHSVGTRLALATALLVLLVAGGVQYALRRYLQQEQLRAKRDAALMVTSLFAELSSAPVLFGDEQGITDCLGYLRSNPEILEAAVFALGPDGQLAPPLATLPSTSLRRSTLQAPHLTSVGTVQPARDTLDVSQWIREPSGKPIAAAVIRFSFERERRSAALLEERIWQISLALAGVVTAALLLLARVYIVGPLQAVHRAVRELSAGSHSVGARERLPLQARDEVGDLARGFLSMAEAIQRREAAIADQNRQMRLVLESVGEGFLVLDAHGAIEGKHSAALEAWFGAVPHGRTLWEYLRPHDPEQAEWLELTWANIGAPFMPLELCVEQMPRTCTAGERHYTIDYRPLTDAQQRLLNMVVIVSDVTELRKREQAEQEQRELVSVFAALMRDRAGFVSFCEDAKQLIDQLSAPAADPAYDLAEHLHTIKGNAFLFRLRAFGEACEQLEAVCAKQRRIPGREDAAPLARAFAESVKPVQQFTTLDQGHNVQLSHHDYEAVIKALRANEAAPQVLRRLQLATAEPAEVVFARFADQLQLLARRLGKCPTQIECAGHGVRFPRETFAPLWSAIVHVLRNIADHALETAWEREQANKPSQAKVLISAEVGADALAIRFRDDGRGIDWQRVREHAEQQGRAAITPADLTAALLGHGFTTRGGSSTLSGRGLGLAALQREVASLGGTIRITSEIGRGTELTIMLPGSLVAAA